jgi:hypothetical protein
MKKEQKEEIFIVFKGTYVEMLKQLIKDKANIISMSDPEVIVKDREHLIRVVAEKR